MLELPGLGELPEPLPSRQLTKEAFFVVALHGKRAGRLLDRLYGPRARDNASFHDMKTLTARTVGKQVRLIVYRLLLQRIIAREIRLGRLHEVEVHGKLFLDTVRQSDAPRP